MQEISEKKSGKLQVWLIFMCVFAYTVSYVSRYSYNANIVAIREYYGADNASAGLAGTFYFFAYGAGQVVNGLLCRRYNKKYCIAAALLNTGLNYILIFGKLGLAPMGIKGAAKPNMSCSLMGSARGAAAFRWDC